MSWPLALVALWPGGLAPLDAAAAATATPAPAAHEAAPVATSVPPRMEHSVGLEGGAWQYLSANYNTSGVTAGASYQLRLREGVAFGAGARLAFGRFVPGAGVEGFVRAGFAPDFDHWRPWVGLELGVSSVARAVVPENRVAPGASERYLPGTDPLYGAFVLAPLRLRFGHVVLQALSLGLGTSLPAVGRALRVSVTLAGVEWVF